MMHRDLPDRSACDTPKNARRQREPPQRSDLANQQRCLPVGQRDSTDLRPTTAEVVLHSGCCPDSSPLRRCATSNTPPPEITPRTCGWGQTDNIHSCPFSCILFSISNTACIYLSSKFVASFIQSSSFSPKKSNLRHLDPLKSSPPYRSSGRSDPHDLLTSTHLRSPLPQSPSPRTSPRSSQSR